MSVARLVGCCLLMLCACTSRAVDLGSLFGQWKIDVVYCRTCASVDRSDVGGIVGLSPDRAVNPLAGGACPGKTGYRIVPHAAPGHAALLQKLDPKWLLKNKDPALLSVTCDDMDFMMYVVLSPDALVYVDDGAIVYHLSRH